MDDERQQRTGADLLREGGVGRAVVAAGQRLALVATNDAVAVDTVAFLGEQLLHLHVQRLRQLQRGGNGRRVQPALDLGQVALGQAGLPGQGLQRDPEFFLSNFKRMDIEDSLLPMAMKLFFLLMTLCVI